MAIAMTLAPNVAIAKCGTGNPPSYDDITAVRFERERGFWTAPKTYRASTFKGSAFWVLFWNLDATKYSQDDLQGQIGTYHLNVSLKDAVDVLRVDDFFALSSPELLITDIQWDVLTARRCSVITKIALPDDPDAGDAKTRKLFDDLEALIVQSTKTTVSKKAEFFYSNLFDP